MVKIPSSTREKIEALVAADLDEFYVEKIIGHSGVGKNPKKWKFRVEYAGYEPEDDTMLDLVKTQHWTSIVRRTTTLI